MRRRRRACGKPPTNRQGRTDLRDHRRAAIGVTLIAMVVFALASPALAAPSRGDVIHVVRRGENLTLLARRYGVSAWAIVRANGITNPDRIYVGQRLVIPLATPSGWITHIVQRGETLTAIGWRYGIDPWTIARANGIANLNLIFVGQAVVLLGTAAPAPVPEPPAPKPPEPESWMGSWSAEYYTDAALTRTDEKIAFDWGYNSPADGIPDYRFSVRWTGTFQFEPGAYRFSSRADDGVTVYIDDVLVIDGWRNGSPRTRSALENLTAGDHEVVVEYYDYIQDAQVYVCARRISGTSPEAESEPAAAGWSAQFYNNETLSGDPVPTRVNPWIGFEWGMDGAAPGVWADHFSARWTNTIALERDHYRFCAMSDAGVRI